MPAGLALRSGRLLARSLPWSRLCRSGSRLHRLLGLLGLLGRLFGMHLTIAINDLGSLLTLGAMPCA
jgi:hypothetical protein